MGNCHSSQSAGYAVAAQPRATRPARPADPSKRVQAYQSQHQTQTQQPASNMWSPPPYSNHLTNGAGVSTTATRSKDSPYAFLAEFDTVFLVDDSTSMAGHRWREAEDAIAAIAPICTQYDSDGIDIYFLNHRNPASAASNPNPARGYKNVRDASGVREIFKSVGPRGATPVGNRLHQILSPYMRSLEGATAAGREGDIKPLNIIVITDGEFTDDAESVIVNVARRLDNPGVAAVPWQVGIQFFQVGDDEAARAHLQALDDELVRRRSYEGIRDIVDTVPWRGVRGGRVLNGEGILKCVLGAVNKKYDKREASR